MLAAPPGARPRCARGLNPCWCRPSACQPGFPPVATAPARSAHAACADGAAAGQRVPAQVPRCLPARWSAPIRDRPIEPRLRGRGQEPVLHVGSGQVPERLPLLQLSQCARAVRRVPLPVLLLRGQVQQHARAPGLAPPAWRAGPVWPFLALVQQPAWARQLRHAGWRQVPVARLRSRSGGQLVPVPFRRMPGLRPGPPLRRRRRHGWQPRYGALHGLRPAGGADAGLVLPGARLPPAMPRQRATRL